MSWDVAMGSNVGWDASLGDVWKPNGDNARWSVGKWFGDRWIAFDNSAKNNEDWTQFLGAHRRPADPGAGGFVCGTFSLYVGGNHYLIPDMWIQFDYQGNHGTRLTGNWQNYGNVQCWQNGQTSSVYALRDGDWNQPWSLTMQTQWDGSNVRVNFTEDSAIILNGDLPTPTWEFDYRLARKRVDEKWNTKVSQFIHGAGDTDYVIASTIDQAYDAALITVDQSKKNAIPEYVSKAVLRNSTTTPLSMRSSDYAHAFAESLAISDSSSQKVALKVAVKFAATALFVKNEFSAELSTEFTWTHTTTETRTDTKTYTVPGQTFVVPANSTYEVATIWNRAIQSGKMHVLAKMDNTARFTAMNSTSSHNATGTWTELIGWLGMTSIVANPNQDSLGPGSYARFAMSFSSVTGAAGQVEITQIPNEGVSE